MNFNSVTTGPVFLTSTTGTGVTTGSFIISPQGQCKTLNVIAWGVAATGAITTGVVTIEESFFQPPPLGGDPVPTTTWSVINTGISGANLTTGAYQAVHVQGSFWNVRVRISTAMSTGAINAVAWTN